MEILIAAAGEGSGNRAGIATGFNRVHTLKFVRESGPGRGGLDLEPGNEQNKAEPRADFEMLMTIVTGHGEAAKFCGGSVIWMAFESGTKSENFCATQRAAAERIQAMQHPKPDGHATAEAPRNGNIPGDRARKWKRLALGCLKERAAGAPDHTPRLKSARPGDGNKVVKSKRNPKAVKTRPKIGGSRGNADRDLLLFQRKSLENAERETAVAMILARATVAARPR
jgi:hypothetical protein